MEVLEFGIPSDDVEAVEQHLDWLAYNYSSISGYRNDVLCTIYKLYCKTDKRNVILYRNTMHPEMSYIYHVDYKEPSSDAIEVENVNYYTLTY